MRDEMGVKFLTCSAAGCGKMFVDTGPHVRCDEDKGGCGSNYCSAEHAQLQRVDAQGEPIPEQKQLDSWSQEQIDALEISCVECRGENATDTNLLEFVLHRFAMTKEEAIAHFRMRENAPNLPFENIDRWLRAKGKNPDDNLWRL